LGTLEDEFPSQVTENYKVVFGRLCLMLCEIRVAMSSRKVRMSRLIFNRCAHIWVIFGYNGSMIVFDTIEGF
jgi:hypothetical protein